MQAITANVIVHRVWSKPEPMLVHDEDGNIVREPSRFVQQANGGQLEVVGKAVTKIRDRIYVDFSPGDDPTRFRWVKPWDELMPTEEATDPGKTDGQYSMARYNAIKPKVDEFLAGEGGVKVDGTPLEQWPTIDEVRCNVVKLPPFYLDTVEKLAEATDTKIERIPLPDIRELREKARVFVAMQRAGGGVGAPELVAENKAMKAEIAEMKEMLNLLLGEKLKSAGAADMEPPKRRGRPPNATEDAA
jgi:hypothetical protein